MKAALAAALLAVLALPAAAQTRTVHVKVRQPVVLEEGDGTATWAVDPSVVEASIHFGRVTVTGRAAGATVVSVANKGGVRSYQVVVDAPPAAVTPVAAAARAGQRFTSVQAGYDSATGRATGTIDLVDSSAGRTRRMHVTAVARPDRTGTTDAPVSVPSASIEIASRRSSLVLLDRFLEHSALTVDGVSVRGAHLRHGALRLHAGFVSPLLYDDVFLPAGAERVGGLALALTSGRWSLTPAVFAFPDAAAAAAGHGLLGSLVAGYGRDGDPFRFRAEAAYGERRWGGAAQLEVDAPGTRLQLRGRHQPIELPSLRSGRPPGTFAEGAWTAASGRLSVSASGVLSRYQLPQTRQHSDAVSGHLRLRLGGSWFLGGGASVGWFGAGGERLRALSAPASLAFEGQRAGLSLQYRYQENTASNIGGSGGRLGLRASGSRLRANVFLDAQRDAPTVDFMLRQEPRLARMLAELGLTVQSPEDVARILAEQAPLFELGYLEGVTVNLNPWRLQGGGDLALSLRKDGRQQLRLRALLDRTRTVTGDRDTTLATLSYSRFVAGAEVIAGYTWSASDVAGWTEQGSSFQLTIRKRFDGLPGLPWGGSDTIAGIVFEDEAGAGAYAPGMPLLAGQQVRLNGARTATTDTRGRFHFAGVGRGPHRLEAVLPATAGAFFTTPSSVLATPGAPTAFGLGRTPALLSGSVRDDAGRGIAGLTVKLSRQGRELTATTDSAGGYEFATAEGDYTLTVAAESLPAGYDATGLHPAGVRLTRAASARLDRTVPAQRALSGRVVANRAARTVVRLLEAARTVEAGPDGSYAFRNLKPGTYTVAAVIGGRSVRRKVEVPPTPCLLRDVDLDPARPVS